MSHLGKKIFPFQDKNAEDHKLISLTYMRNQFHDEPYRQKVPTYIRIPLVPYTVSDKICRGSTQSEKGRDIE
jgi:hypothetical protein